MDAVLGFDVGGTKVLTGLVDEKGQILAQLRRPAARGDYAALLRGMKEDGDALLRAASVRPVALGIGIKGFVDARHGFLVSSSLVGPVPDGHLCGSLAAHFGIMGAMDNDVHAATLAEARWGAGKDEDYFSFINVGTGIAIGVMEGGRLLRGRTNGAGEVGYGLCRRAGDRAYSQMEHIASGKGLAMEAQRLAAQYPTRLPRDARAEEILDAWQAGDPLAVAAVESCLDILAAQVIQYDFLLNSQLYIFAGGVVVREDFFAALCRKVESLQREQGFTNSLRLCRTQMGAAQAGLLGAACLGLSARGGKA